jgi:hypothetical protein
MTTNLQSPIRLKSLPDLGGIFAQMKIRDGLEAIHHEKTILGLSIGMALRKKTPLGQILKTITDHYYDCPEGVIDVVGEDLMNRILNFIKNKP